MDILGKANINDTVTFSLYEKTQVIIGTPFQDCVILGIINAAMTPFLKVDPDALHASVFGTLPAGVAPDNPREYRWLHIRLMGGAETAIGEPWIMPDSITVKTGNTAYLQIPNCNQTDIENIRRAISGVGKTISSLELRN